MIGVIEFTADPVALKTRGHCRCRAASDEWVKHHTPHRGAREDAGFNQLLRICREVRTAVRLRRHCPYTPLVLRFLDRDWGRIRTLIAAGRAAHGVCALSGLPLAHVMLRSRGQ